MKRMQQFGAALLALVMTASLAACGGGSAESTTAADQNTTAAAPETTAVPQEEASGGEKVTLSYYYWDATFAEEIDELIQGYYASRGDTNITIEPTQLPWDEYWTKLGTTLATGDDAPDIFWVNLAHLVEYLPAGYMLPLEDGVVDLDKYTTTAMDLLKGDDGKHYGVPFLLDPNVLIYNKAMFDEAGLEYPNEDWTWDDFREAAAALTKDDGTQYGY